MKSLLFRLTMQVLFLNSCSAAIAATEEPEVSAQAKDIFYSKPGGPTLPANSIALSVQYKILVKRGDEVAFVAPSFPFRSGDKFRVFFQANQPGFAYLLNRGSGGEGHVLFPSLEINAGSNKIPALAEYTIPSEGWYEFDRRPGVEEMIILFSLQPLENLKSVKAGMTITPATFRDTVTAIVDQREAALRRDRDRGARDVIFVDSLDADTPASAGPVPAQQPASPVFTQTGSQQRPPQTSASVIAAPEGVPGVAAHAIVPSVYASSVIHESEPFLISQVKLQHQ